MKHDQALIDACCQGKPRAWPRLVDRLLPLVHHVVDHLAAVRDRRLAAAERQRLIVSVFAKLADDDGLLLRRYDGRSRLDTYVVVVARRIVLGQLSASESS